MRTPLLTHETPSKFRRGGKWISFFLFSSVLFFIFHVSFQSRNQHASWSMTEVSVGANEATTQLIRIHFWIGDFVTRMENSRHFCGVNTMKYVPFEQFCPHGTPPCDHICQERMLGKDVSSPVCVSTNTFSGKEEHECWPTTDMRCWGMEKFVWDGSKEWKVIQDDLVGEPGMTWIHLQDMVAPFAHLIVFGHGKITSFDKMAHQFTESKKLMKTLDSIPMEVGIMLCGHSMGAAWATYTHAFLGIRKKPHNKRFVVATGMPLASRQYNQLFRAENSHTKFTRILLLALESQGRMLTDVQMIEQAPDLSNAVSLPQFAYACNIDAGIFMCKDPQPARFSIDDSLATLHNKFDDPIVNLLNDFNSYRQCFDACTLKFLRQDFKYGANIDGFQPRPLPPADSFRPLPVGADSPDATDPSNLPPIAHSEVQSIASTSADLQSQSTALVPQHPAMLATAIHPGQIGASSSSQAGPSSSSQNFPQAQFQANPESFSLLENVYNTHSAGVGLPVQPPPSAPLQPPFRFNWKPTRVLQEGFQRAPTPPQPAVLFSSQPQNWKSPRLLEQGFNPALIPRPGGSAQSTHELPSLEDASRGLVALSSHIGNSPVQDLLSLSASGTSHQSNPGSSSAHGQAQSSDTSSPSLKGISKNRNYALAQDTRDRLDIILEDENPEMDEELEDYMERVFSIMRKYFRIKKLKVKRITLRREWFVEGVRNSYDEFFRRNPQDPQTFED